jgi:hypothetical protein
LQNLQKFKAELCNKEKETTESQPVIKNRNTNQPESAYNLDERYWIKGTTQSHAPTGHHETIKLQHAEPSFER